MLYEVKFEESHKIITFCTRNLKMNTVFRSTVLKLNSFKKIKIVKKTCTLADDD